MSTTEKDRSPADQRDPWPGRRGDSNHPSDLDRALSTVRIELHKATEKYGPFASTHEGYAVIHEELDELWDEVKTNGSNQRLRKEATQVAAMAIRFMLDIAK